MSKRSMKGLGWTLMFVWFFLMMAPNTFLCWLIQAVVSLAGIYLLVNAYSKEKKKR